MKNMMNNEPRNIIAQVSPKSKSIRKSSQERKEREKVTARLRQLVGTHEESSQLDLVLATIAHIRELQSMLNGKENELPSGFEESFAACTSTGSSRPDTPEN